MNRFTQKVVSGGIAAGLSVAVAVSATAQARSGAWTLSAPEGEWYMTGRDYSLQRFSPLKQITTSNVAELRPDRKSTRLNSSHSELSRMPSSA